MSESQVREVGPETKLAGAWLVLENTVQVLSGVWLFLWSMEAEADEECREQIRAERLQILKQIEIVKSERGLFNAEAPTHADFH